MNALREVDSLGHVHFYVARPALLILLLVPRTDDVRLSYVGIVDLRACISLIRADETLDVERLDWRFARVSTRNIRVASPPPIDAACAKMPRAPYLSP